jgi:hypothetical protein
MKGSGYIKSYGIFINKPIDTKVIMGLTTTKLRPLKKRSIIHKSLHSIRYGNPEGEYYLCNEAVKVNSDKMSYRWNKVTCKNCLKQRKEVMQIIEDEDE